MLNGGQNGGWRAYYTNTYYSTFLGFFLFTLVAAWHNYVKYVWFGGGSSINYVGNRIFAYKMKGSYVGYMWNKKEQYYVQGDI